MGVFMYKMRINAEHIVDMPYPTQILEHELAMTKRREMRGRKQTFG